MKTHKRKIIEVTAGEIYFANFGTLALFRHFTATLATEQELIVVRRQPIAGGLLFAFCTE